MLALPSRVSGRLFCSVFACRVRAVDVSGYAHGAVGSDLLHSLIVVIRYDDAALAIHANPTRTVELRCCAGAVRKPGTSGPCERAHGAVGSDLVYAMVAVVRYDDAALAIHGNPLEIWKPNDRDMPESSPHRYSTHIMSDNH